MTLAMPEFAPTVAARDGPAEPRWQIDRRVPVALIMTILMQTAVFGIWLGRTDARLDALEQFERDNKTTDARLAVIESRLDALHETLGAIGHKLNIEEQ
jgi:hypothetical protein